MINKKSLISKEKESLCDIIAYDLIFIFNSSKISKERACSGCKIPSQSKPHFLIHHPEPSGNSTSHLLLFSLILHLNKEPYRISCFSFISSKDVLPQCNQLFTKQNSYQFVVFREMLKGFEPISRSKKIKKDRGFLKWN